MSLPCRRLVLGLSFLVLGMALAAARDTAAEDKPATYEELIDEGQDLLSQKDCSSAIKAFRKAEKLAPTPTFVVLNGAARAYTCFGSWPDAESYARRAIDAAVEPEDKAEAHYLLGQTLLRGGGATEEQLTAAAESLRQALEVSGGKLVTARYDLGGVLLKLGQDEHGVEELKRFLEQFPQSPKAARARALIANPRRGRVPMVPDFEAVTLDGRRLTDEALLGKVVLFSFWETGNALCREAVPELQRWNKRSATEPFSVLSISTDRTDVRLRELVAELGMSWPQIYDESQALDRDFEITAVPTFILADHEGVILYRVSGWSRAIQKDLIHRILEAIPEAKNAAR